MKNKILVRWLTVFSLVSAVSVGIVIACGGWDDYGYAYSDFAPEPYADETYKPLFYSSTEMFYQIGYNNNHINRFNEEVSNDWKNYLKGKLDDTNITFFLFDEQSVQIVEELYQALFKNARNNTFTEWSSKINMNSPEIKSFIEFLYLAKKVELSSVSSFDYWDYENAKEPARVEQDVLMQLVSKYQNSSDLYLKNRYWFQCMKAYFYSETKADVIAFFENTHKNNPKNTLYYRALAYVAGAENRAKNYSKSNYLYSIVFDKCPSLRTEVIYSFHPQDDSDWENALKLAKTNDEKAALWAMLGYYVDEARAINEIYKLNPQNQHIDFLLTRLINKTEQILAYVKVGPIPEYKNEVKSKIETDALSIVSNIAQAGNTSKPYFWNMAAGYLQTLAGNYQKSVQFFDIAQTQLPDNLNFRNQLRLLRLINSLFETQIMNSVSENKLVAELDWLYNQLPKTAKEGFRFENSTNLTKAYLSNLYKSQGNQLMAELFSEKQDFYFNDDNVEAMRLFMERTDKTPIEKLAESVYPVKIGDIYEFKAVIATFDNRLDDAYAFMQKADWQKDQLLLANPFNGFVKDCHDCEHAAPQKTKFSKLRLVEVMQIMQGKIAKGEELYNNYLLMANAFYNITYYGNARLFYEGNIIGRGKSTYWDIDERHRQMIEKMTNAKMFYQKALKAATTDEQKAKCVYMLAKCQRNDFYNGTYVSPNNQGADFLAWDGFVRLKNLYSNTKYYKEVIAECGYFAKYVGVK